MAANNPSKTEIDGLFHRLRGIATNKVGGCQDFRIGWDTHPFTFGCTAKSPDFTLILLPGMLRLWRQESHVVQCDLRRVHLHRLLSSAS